jgi:hypothetical protein
MKFYRNFNYNEVRMSKIIAICSDYYGVVFYKNGKMHNTRNAAYINDLGYKQFVLNDKYYGVETNFTKESWRRFVKLKVFL